MTNDTGKVEGSEILHPTRLHGLDRRRFLKIGTLATASGALIGMDRALPSLPAQAGRFPVEVTERCRRMDQKYTIFARQLWDFEFLQEIEDSIDRAGREALEEVKGWTPLDEALNDAAWALDHRFASGSENGQPHSQAYAWDEPVRRRKVEFTDPEDAGRKIKKAARYLGADLVGIAPYDPLWTYSKLIKADLDSDPGPGKRPEIEHFVPEFPFEPRSVVVLAVEMDYETIALSPSSLEGAATGLGYSRMCSVGYSVATFIRGLGYRAFANGNDVSLSIPYAIAAGMGELGRHGMLITPEFGPRVRLVKVFTELELEPDKPRAFGAWEFCRNCKRCADSCPSRAVPYGSPTLEGQTISNNPGVLKWYIDPEKCIRFWRENGSDCANCITACPFNKLPMWHHRISAGAAALPIAPLHMAMAKLDQYFGFGNVYDTKANEAFWDKD